MMWIAFALGSALFAGVVSILAKIGMTDVDSTLATALRTTVVVIFAWLMVLVVGSQTTITQISPTSLIFLILSGLATGGSWLCYFKALQIGDINKVVPIDKSSTVLTMLLAFIFLGEGLDVWTIIAMVAIGVGTIMMINRQPTTTGATVRQGKHAWLFYACGSALFAALTSILGKVGISDVESNLGTAIRTVVVLVLAWLIVLARGQHHAISRIDRRGWVFLILSGLATGLSWLCFFRALHDGPASVVVPIDKLSIVITVTFGGLVFHEKLNLKSGVGLALIVIGTLSLLWV